MRELRSEWALGMLGLGNRASVSCPPLVLCTPRVAAEAADCAFAPSDVVEWTFARQALPPGVDWQTPVLAPHVANTRPPRHCLVENVENSGANVVLSLADAYSELEHGQFAESGARAPAIQDGFLDDLSTTYLRRRDRAVVAESGPESE